MEFTITKDKLYETFYKLGVHRVDELYLVENDNSEKDIRPDKIPIYSKYKYERILSTMASGEFIIIQPDFPDLEGNVDDLTKLLYSELVPSIINMNTINKDLRYSDYIGLLDYYLTEILLKLFSINRDAVNYRTQMFLNKENSVIITECGSTGVICFTVFLELVDSKINEEFKDVTIDIDDSDLRDCPEVRQYLLNKME